MTLACDITASRGGFTVHVEMAAADGEVLAIVGPNGAGKSTLLRAVAGLVASSGRIVVDGADVAGRLAQHRAVGWVPQEGALFPHLSALDNVAFGLGGRRGRARAAEWLDHFGMSTFADRRPAQLSGGQAQKVALARALAREPRVLLLDEPLAALDVSARTDVRRALREHLAGFDGVTLIVTHDAVDAATLADRIVALEAGAVVQDEPVGEVTRAPRTAWLAELVGANAFRGRVSGTTVSLEGGGRIVVAERVGEEGASALAVVPLHAVTLHDRRPHGSARNAWPVTVRQLTSVSSRVRVQCDGQPAVVAEVTPGAVAELGLHEGAAAWASVKATEVTVVLL
jgi:molybdopterin-binding protein